MFLFFYIYLLHLKAVIDIINNVKVFESFCVFCAHEALNPEYIYKIYSDLKKGISSATLYGLKLTGKNAFRTYK